MPLDAVATSYRQTAFFGEPSPQRRNRIALGVGVSLMLHALLLATYRNKPADIDAEDAAPRRSIAVWLRPRPPPPPPVPERQPEPAAQAAPSKPAASAQPRRRERVIAVTPEPAAPSRPDVFAVEPEPETPAPERKEDGAPRFDPDAARKMARKLASGPDPATAGTAVGQFPAKPLETETKAARAISRTRRRDCKDGLPGGLLAPLFLAMDKKDSGCQW